MNGVKSGCQGNVIGCHRISWVARRATCSREMPSHFKVHAYYGCRVALRTWLDNPGAIEEHLPLFGSPGLLLHIWRHEDGHICTDLEQQEQRNRTVVWEPRQARMQVWTTQRDRQTRQFSAEFGSCYIPPSNSKAHYSRRPGRHELACRGVRAKEAPLVVPCFSPPGRAPFPRPVHGIHPPCLQRPQRTRGWR